MNTTYDEFRKMEDPISAVRNYYKNNPKGKAGQSMPWWITTNEVDRPHSFNVQMWNSLDAKERDILLAKSMVLLPNAIDPSAENTKYYPISLWLCSCYQIVVPNIRDLFSAGGKITHENGVLLQKPVPKVFGMVIKHLDTISKVLNSIDDEMALMIIEHNPALAKCAPNFYQGWISQFKDIAAKNGVSSELIDRWIIEKPTLKSAGSRNNQQGPQS